MRKRILLISCLALFCLINAKTQTRKIPASTSLSTSPVLPNATELKTRDVIFYKSGDWSIGQITGQDEEWYYLKEASGESESLPQKEYIVQIVKESIYDLTAPPSDKGIPRQACGNKILYGHIKGGIAYFYRTRGSQNKTSYYLSENSEIGIIQHCDDYSLIYYKTLQQPLILGWISSESIGVKGQTNQIDTENKSVFPVNENQLSFNYNANNVPVTKNESGFVFFEDFCIGCDKSQATDILNRFFTVFKLSRRFSSINSINDKINWFATYTLTSIKTSIPTSVSLLSPATFTITIEYRLKDETQKQVYQKSIPITYKMFTKPYSETDLFNKFIENIDKYINTLLYYYCPTELDFDKVVEFSKKGEAKTFTIVNDLHLLDVNTDYYGLIYEEGAAKIQNGSIKIEPKLGEAKLDKFEGSALKMKIESGAPSIQSAFASGKKLKVMLVAR